MEDGDYYMTVSKAVEVVDQERIMMPVNQTDIAIFKKQREVLRSFIHSELKAGIDNDFAQIPGTNKNSLLKPGAQKLRQIFGLGIKVDLVEKEIDRVNNFAQFTYRAIVYHLKSGVTVSQCDGTVNSWEKKYKERKVWKKENGKSIQVTEETPVCDVLNTLMKMAQKRAIIGATIEATGASDFFTQDLEDEIVEAKEIKSTPTEEPKANTEEAIEQVPVCCGGKMMISKYPDPVFGDIPPYYCLKCKKKIKR